MLMQDNVIKSLSKNLEAARKLPRSKEWSLARKTFISQFYLKLYDDATFTVLIKTLCYEMAW